MAFSKNVITDEQFAALKAKHGEQIVCVETASGDVALRAPTREEFREFVRELGGARKNVKAEQLIRICLLAPDSATFDAMEERRPGIVATLSNPLVALTGMESDPKSTVLPDEAHDEVLIVTTVAGTLKFRCPRRSENQQYESEADDPRKKGDAVDRLVKDCLLPAEGFDFKAALNKWPALGLTCIDPLRKFAGVEVSAAVKK